MTPFHKAGTGRRFFIAPLPNAQAAVSMLAAGLAKPMTAEKE